MRLVTRQDLAMLWLVVKDSTILTAQHLTGKTALEGGGAEG
ncbi:MAG TPA: hypothetical protein VEC99_14240 [Clostridia bacterium]|nr:hypothetical protein [Clostridia bacterium]